MPAPVITAQRPDKTDRLFFSAILLYFAALGYFVLSGTYLFSDEAYMLWNNRNGRVVFDIFNSQGRGLTGLLMEFLFREFDTVEKLKMIRLISLAGWLVTTCYLYVRLRQAAESALPALDIPMACLLCFFFAASLSVTISIGWAACAEIFLAALAAAYAGFTLFGFLQSQEGRIKIPWSVYGKVIGAGLLSLFLYQSLFPLMLLPFFLLFTGARGQDRMRKIYVALIFHAAIYFLYYAGYKSLLGLTHAAESTRTGLSNAPLQKLGFFFSFPLNQAFHLNHPFSARNLLDQLVLPLLGAALAIIVLAGKGPAGAERRLKYLAGLLFFWVLAFLPQLISRENFGPYRTMLPLSMAVFASLAALILPLFRSKKVKQAMAIFGAVLLLVNGVYNYYHFIFRPLRFEYEALSGHICRQYRAPVSRIVFVRPPENGFETVLGTRNYKDEFGMPSTSKDWVPEALVKQVLMEKKGIPAEALNRLEIVQVSAGTGINPADSLKAGTLVIDVVAVLTDYKKALSERGN